MLTAAMRNVLRSDRTCSSASIWLDQGNRGHGDASPKFVQALPEKYEAIWMAMMFALRATPSKMPTLPRLPAAMPATCVPWSHWLITQGTPAPTYAPEDPPGQRLDA